MSARLPDLKIAPGTITNNITIRGVGSGNNPGCEQSVATFVDGIYRSRSRSPVRHRAVEVLKGPQTTFFGANAIAGALNIVTRRPGTDFDYNASAYGAPSTGDYVTTWFDLHRIRDGKIAEHWDPALRSAAMLKFDPNTKR